MNEQKKELKKGVPALLLAVLCFLLAPLSALFLAEAHSFIALFDALTVEARAAFPAISLAAFAGFLLLQAVLTGLCAELFYKKQGQFGVIAVLAGALGTVCGIAVSPLFYGRIEASPFLLVCAFVLAAPFMARSYKKGEDKKTSILWACGGAGIVLALTLLTAALLCKEGFVVYFKDFFVRIARGAERYAHDSVAVQVALSGGEQPFFEMMTAGQRVDPEMTAELFVTAYRESYAGACAFLIYLLPGVLFCLLTVPCYIGYGTFRLCRLAGGNTNKRYLKASPVAAVTLALCLLFYAFVSIFIGGSFLTVLVLNLIVMLTPLLFVPGLKVTLDMMKQLFKNNKLMFAVCGVIILLSPLMVVALSGCYAVFGEMLKKHLEKKGFRP